MSTPLDEQIKQLKQAITELDAQRSILGDEAVEDSPLNPDQSIRQVRAVTA